MSAFESSDKAAPATSGPDARRVFGAVLFVMILLKMALAAELSLFGDEAFYWQESRALAWGYSDVPPLTPWLIRLGTAYLGHSELGVRLPFLVLGTLVPMLVIAWARRFV